MCEILFSQWSSLPNLIAQGTSAVPVRFIALQNVLHQVIELNVETANKNHTWDRFQEKLIILIPHTC